MVTNVWPAVDYVLITSIGSLDTEQNGCGHVSNVIS